MSNLQNAIFRIIAQQGGIAVSTVNLESKLEDLGIESLDVVKIIFAIENYHDISLPNFSPTADLQSVRGLVDVVQQLLIEKRACASETAANPCAA